MRRQRQITVLEVTDVHYLLLDDVLMDPVGAYKRKDLIDIGTEALGDYQEAPKVHKIHYNKRTKLRKMTRAEWRKIVGC